MGTLTDSGFIVKFRSVGTLTDSGFTVKFRSVGTTTFRKTPNHKTLLDSELFSELVPKSQRSLRDHSLEIFNKMQ
ncbi:hypothetical protein [Leptospira noguchii]|uniref:hypothetical protein n=1 Tax=Leptospira noguchii TaxID=28182 RepID=UPI000345CE2E|nr:hypothetical protein [Leptospira noguchii]